MPLGIGEMKGLQTLSKISIGGKNEYPISGLKNLKNLRRRVCIDGLDKLQNNDQTREVNLSQMRLSELVVEWSDVFDGSRKQRLETEVLDKLKPHNNNLKKLEVVSYGGTEFPKWVTDPSFIRLTDLSIEKCRNCVFLPPLGHMPSLKKLSIESMDDVKEVGSELLGNGPVAFPSLEILRFEKMPQWEVWSVNVVGVAVFPCLKELHIRNCPNMARWEVWSVNSDVRVFPCLEKLLIDDCLNLVKASLEALPSLRDLEIKECGGGVLKSLVGVASSVTKLAIEGISGLSDEVWGGVAQSLLAVEELSIKYCNEIRYLWESKVEAYQEVLLNLKKLKISSCEKLARIGGGGGEKEEERIIETLYIDHCENLKLLNCPNNIETLDINHCENLEHLSCPANNIQNLRFSNCSSITSVSFPAEGGRGWQMLKSLHIWSCNSELAVELEKQVLTVIKNTTNIMPILEFIRISDWKDLKSTTKFTCFTQLTRLIIQDCGRIESFPDLQDLMSLKNLRIKNCKSMDGPPLPLRRSSSGGCVSGVWPPKLDSLSIGMLKSPISEWGPLPTSLVHLTLWGGFGSPSAEEDDDVKSFPSSLLPYSLSSSLTSLDLLMFKKMERISSEAVQHLTSLQHLSILWCPKMKDLPESLLPSLLSLAIIRCPNKELKEKMMNRSGSYWLPLSYIPRVEII